MKMVIMIPNKNYHLKYLKHSGKRQISQIQLHQKEEEREPQRSQQPQSKANDIQMKTKSKEHNQLHQTSCH